MPFDGSDSSSPLPIGGLGWHFAVGKNDAPAHKPRLDQFFGFGIHKYEALIREALQNSRDNKIDESTEAVLLSIRIRKVSKSVFMSLFRDDIRHWKKCGVDVEKIVDNPDNRRVAFFEDFNTKGLRGKPGPYNLERMSPWAAFFQGTGLTTKTGKGQGGAFGVGKTVYASASQFKAFVAYTIRVEDEDPDGLLMGQAILDPHQLETEKSRYEPIGVFCHDRDEDGFVLPYDGEEARQIADMIGFERQAGEPGMSVAVMCPREDVNERNLVKATLEHFHYQIAMGEVEVSIQDDDGHPEGHLLNAETIKPEIRRVWDTLDEPAGIDALVGLARAWSHGHVAERTFEVESRGQSLSAADFVADDLASLCDAWKHAHPFALRVRFPIARKDRDESVSSTEAHGHVTILMRAAAEGESPKTAHVRQSVNLIDNAKGGAHGNSSFAIVIAENDPEMREAHGCDASLFFSMSEAPAHTRWFSKVADDHFSINSVKRAFRPVRHWMRDIEQVLSPASERDRVTSVIESLLAGLGGSGGGESLEETPEPGVCSYLDSSQSNASHIRVKFSGARLPEEYVGQRVRFAFGYERPGKSEVFWKRGMFALDSGRQDGPAASILAGGDILAQENNEIEVRVNSADFDLSVIGFDPNCKTSFHMWTINEAEEAIDQ